MTRQFTDRVALVTGGNSGLGLATALAFAREGAKVAIAARRTEEGNAAVAAIEATGGEATFVQTDVSQPAEVKAMVDTVMATFGRLDYAFNNAGRSGIAPICAMSEQFWDDLIDTNLKGVWLCMKHQIPQILTTGGGAIVNNSSVSGLGGWDGGAAYVASKHGVIGMTRCAAIEYATQGIRVNAICPGNFETPIWDDLELTEEQRSRRGAAHPMDRMGKPEEIAEAVLWLCSDASSFVTGVALPIDGGMTARP